MATLLGCAPLRDKLLCVQLAGRSVKNHGRPAEVNSIQLTGNSCPLNWVLLCPFRFSGFAKHALFCVIASRRQHNHASAHPQLTLPPTYADPSSSLFFVFMFVLSFVCFLWLCRYCWCGRLGAVGGRLAAVELLWLSARRRLACWSLVSRHVRSVLSHQPAPANTPPACNFLFVVFALLVRRCVSCSQTD